MKKYDQRLVCGNQYNVSMKSLKIFKSKEKGQKDEQLSTKHYTEN